MHLLHFYFVGAAISRQLAHCANIHALCKRMLVAHPRSLDICLSVYFTLDYVPFSQTDCAIVHFNLDKGNKAFSWHGAAKCNRRRI